jgi:transposase
MKRVDTIARVRRAFYVLGWSMKKIVRDLHVSRNTVRKILRTDETDFSYERERQPMPRIGPWQGQLEQFLSANANKPSRERLTLIRIFEELRGLGYEGGYDAVRRFAKSWSQTRGAVTAQAYVPLYYAPGEAYQFDWSHEVVVISGITVTVKVAHVRLCHSRMMFARAYMRESQEMVFDAHDRAFAFFKGTCTRGIYDNMKTAVEAVFTGKERHYNRRFLQMCSHYLVQPVACTPASGWERAIVRHWSEDNGEWSGREPGRAGAGTVLHAAAAGEEPRRVECLAAGQMRGLRKGAPPPRRVRQDDLGDVRGRAPASGAVCGPL